MNDTETTIQDLRAEVHKFNDDRDWHQFHTPKNVAASIVIEEYPHLHRHLPDCLVLTFVSPNEPLHCVVALNEPRDYILIVTVYRPTAEEWKDDWRTRK